jgi:hypothetical protein
VIRHLLSENAAPIAPFKLVSLLKALATPFDLDSEAATRFESAPLNPEYHSGPEGLRPKGSATFSEADPFLEEPVSPRIPADIRATTAWRKKEGAAGGQHPNRDGQGESRGAKRKRKSGKAGDSNSGGAGGKPSKPEEKGA